MATYNLSTTAAQEKVVSFAFRRENARRRAAGLSPLADNAALVQTVFADWLKEGAAELREHLKQRVGDEYDKSATVTKADIQTTLGINPDAEE